MCVFKRKCLVILPIFTCLDFWIKDGSCTTVLLLILLKMFYSMSVSAQTRFLSQNK